MELSAPQQRRVPGDLAMWCFILAELAVFGVFFLAYAWARRQQPALFAAGQGGLELGLPTLNTLLLLAGSAAMLAALSAFRRQAARRTALAGADPAGWRRLSRVERL